LKNRLIQASDIPKNLWCPISQKLSLPDDLVQSWKSLLNQNNLLELALQKAPKGFEGGISKEETDKHLAWRYNGSCARVILSILDPKHELNEISDAYASTFAGGKVFLADIPCGSGAGLISILCTLCSLRAQNILPRHPLNIEILAGEISDTARNYVETQISNIDGSLKNQAIWVNLKTIKWDALCKFSTANLTNESTILSQGCTAKLIILSNFSGFLEKENKWKEAMPQFDSIFTHNLAINSTAIWIEPQKSNVTPFFQRIKKWISKSFQSLTGKKNEENPQEWHSKSSIDCTQPIKDGHFPARITVMRFDLSPEI